MLDVLNKNEIEQLRPFRLSTAGKGIRVIHCH